MVPTREKDPQLASTRPPIQSLSIMQKESSAMKQ